MRLFYKSFIYTGIVITFVVALIISQDALAGPGGNGKGGNAGGGNGGDPELVYSAAGSLIDVLLEADYIDSTNLNFDEIIFRPSAEFTVDLGGFTVSDPGGGSCSNFSTTTGTLVLAPGDSAAPGSAELRFGFQGKLSGSGGKTVQHYLVMQGSMIGDWPPASYPDTTELTFNNDWSISAEGRKSQKSDCEGSDLDGNPVDPVVIYIWLSTP